MLRRMELYADAALLSFPVSLVVVLLGSRLRLGPMLDLAMVFVAIGGIIAVWAARMLHHRELHEELSRTTLMQTGFVALGIVLLAALLFYAGGGTSGNSPPALWYITGISVIGITFAMLWDAFADIVRGREHRVDDVIRILVIGLLGFSWLGAGLPEAFGADIGPWVVAVTVYMLVVATAAFIWDMVVMRLTRAKDAGASHAIGGT
ncbi:MAG TPA: hypothetical protein VFG89_09545 [Coriobacteriia bacterium]|nr:hypothetical protein [Coriobacteriia bacterium]